MTDPCPPPDNRALCAAFSPILASRADVLTDLTARMIQAYDETGARLGCWPAASAKK